METIKIIETKIRDSIFNVDYYEKKLAEAKLELEVWEEKLKELNK